MQFDAHTLIIPLYCYYLGFISAFISAKSFFVNDLNIIEMTLLGILDGLGLFICIKVLKSKSLKSKDSEKE